MDKDEKFNVPYNENVVTSQKFSREFKGLAIRNKN